MIALHYRRLLPDKGYEYLFDPDRVSAYPNRIEVEVVSKPA